MIYHIKNNSVYKLLILVLLSVIRGNLSEAQVIIGGNEVKFVINNYKGPENYKSLAQRAISILNETVNSKEFKDSILQYPFNWEQSPDWCHKKEKIENRIIFDELFSNRIIKINLSINSNCFSNLWKHYWPWSGEIGKDNSNLPYTVITNEWFLKKQSRFPKKADLETKEINAACSYADNIAHEYCHMTGFCHSRKKYAGREKTVPYGIGDLILRTAKRHVMK